MLVYSTHFTLDKSVSVRQILSIVALWLTQKTKIDFSASQLLQNKSSRLRTGFDLETYMILGDYPSANVVRLSHGDDQVPGRQWVTEIAVRQLDYNRDIECTINLSTNEISARVVRGITPTRPRVILEIVKNCKPVGGTPGTEILEIDETNTEIAKYLILDPNRQHPVIIISPYADGTYPIDVEKLRELVVTIADIVKIKPNADTYEISRQLGGRYSAWRGAMNIVFAKYGDEYSSYVMLPDQMTDFIIQDSLETEVFSIITHKTNIPNSRKQISHHYVNESNLRLELHRKKKEAQESKDVGKYVSFLESYIKSQEQQNSRLRAEADEYAQLYDECENEMRQMQFDMASLKHQLTQAGAQKYSDYDEKTRIALFNSFFQKPNPTECLLSLCSLFPKEVEILESAWKSAKESDSFKYGDRLMILLKKLVFDYRMSLIEGKGDSNALNIFGKESFTAKESETTESNKRAIELRTFDYDGEQIHMVKHLKIGVNPSAAETIRVHFHWDSKLQKIVIGHCGQHLDLR